MNLYGEHVPRMHKAIAALLIGVGVMFSGALDVKFIHSWYTIAALVVGIIIILTGLVEVWLLISCEQRQVKYSDERLIIALTSADPQIREWVGLLSPRYNFRFDGQHTYTAWQDTAVPREIFWRFLKESNDKNTVAQRAWKALGKIDNYNMHECWIIIYEKLVEMGLVIKESHTGPYSEFWIGGGFDKAYDRWPPPRIEELE